MFLSYKTTSFLGLMEAPIFRAVSNYRMSAPCKMAMVLFFIITEENGRYLY